MGHDDFATEPVPGLPERPPKDEAILWQGRPDPWALARDALAIRPVAVYFAILALWRGIVAGDEGGIVAGLAGASWYVAIGAVACGLLYAVAFAQARASLYTITNKRVAMRVGAALTVTFNLPYSQIETAGLALGKDGTGSIALKLKGANTVSYLILWPHVRPWRIAKTEPTLRAIPEAAKVARILAEAAESRLAMPVVTAKQGARSDARPGAAPAFAAE